VPRDPLQPPRAPLSPEGLNEARLVEKENLLIDYRWAGLSIRQTAGTRRRAGQRPVDAIFATGTWSRRSAAKSATMTIPIVFANGSDPVQYGLGRQLQPAGRQRHRHHLITAAQRPKTHPAAAAANPKTAVIAVLVNPRTRMLPMQRPSWTPGRSIGVDIIVVNASTKRRRKAAFDRGGGAACRALLVHVDALFNDVGRRRSSLSPRSIDCPR